VPSGVHPTENEHRLVLPLVQQFAALQQHMFDQFNQTMVMLVQMLAAMQQEQVGLIREEMRHFQKATDELARLRQQLRDSQTAPAPAAAPANAPQPAPGRWAAGTWPGAWTPLPADQPAPKGGPGVPPRLVDAPAAHSPPDQKEAEATADEAVHLWLHERIEQLQTERQNRWQRILGFIRGT
jgi:hypothetical protein